jgi:hypothetical protein
MGTNQQYIKELAVFHQKVTDLSKIMPSEIDYKIKSVFNGYQEMFDRFCPFQIGDKVVLSKVPDFTKAPGLESSKHFLIEGAIAIVKTRNFKNQLFIFGLEFEEDSWIDTQGVIHKRKPEGRYLLCISELSLASYNN